ncbi:MAG: HAD hydrolase family protein, partial [Clostridia bacterium]|nr:HAD hydrolase family protein [Clostridia bacterium]
NDIEMLRAADIGYAVKNACEALRAVADRTAPACGKGAIAAIVAELETRDL